MRQEDCSTLRDPQQKMLDGRTPELHVQSSAHYKVHITYGRVGPPVAALRCYALPVLWMTSYLHIMAWDRRRKKDVHSKRLSRGSRIWHRDVRLNWPTRGSTGSGTESDIYNFLVEKIVDVFWNSANSYLQNRLTFGEVKDKSLVSCFFDSRCTTSCTTNQTLTPSRQHLSVLKATNTNESTTNPQQRTNEQQIHNKSK